MTTILPRQREWAFRRIVDALLLSSPLLFGDLGEEEYCIAG